MNLRLPIDDLLPEIVASLRASPSLVVEAPPGAGKTTRVPPALLQAGFGDGGEIVVLEPRRLPARLAASRVADELGEPVGGQVGYTVRFENRTGPATRVRFVTEGILTRRLLEDPTLRGVSTVILDEFHERHLATDLALALLHRLQSRERPDLRLCVMSATLQAEPISAFLGGCPRLRSEGRLFDVAVEHLSAPDERPLEQQVAAAVRRLTHEEPDGDVLVFLPGAAEIRRAAGALDELAAARNLMIVPLHGDLPLQEQDRAVRRGDRRKVILTTNVAESSITVEGVVAVVDSGLARVAGHSPWTGLSTLAVAKVSQASAIQRAGRAGRTRPGRALRLFTIHDFNARRPFDLPEIVRLDLAEMLLELAGLGVHDADELAWLEPPPAPALGAARELLGMLGALDARGAPTPLGRRMLRLPLHPRLARVVCEGERLGIAPAAADAAALLAERDIRQHARGALGRAGAPRGAQTDVVDIIELLDLLDGARRAGFDRRRLAADGVDARAAQAADRAAGQLARIARSAAPAPASVEERDARVETAVLAGFPDRVARRRGDSSDIVLSGGGAASVPPGAAGGAEFMVALDVEERAAAGRRSGTPLVRLVSAVRPEWLIDLYPERLAESDELVWNERTERVERAQRLTYGALTLDESVTPAPAGPEAAALLARAIAGRGVESLLPEGGMQALAVRLELLRGAYPSAGVPALDEAGIEAALREACAGAISMAELREWDLGSRLLGSLPATARRLLHEETPERLTLPSGRSVVVNYQAGQPPWIESRLQDFFGMGRGPALCGGRVPLTLHLLAPNGRAVQVTSDLERFWQQHYPALRGQLSRRYPKHAWPEDGRHATPPPPHRRPRG